MREILKNTIRCNNCGDVIESNYRHDYVKCSCGRVAVDGGRDYLRRSFTESPDDYTELSVFNEKRHNPEQISQAITSAFSQSRNGTISRKVEIATLPSRQQGTEVAGNSVRIRLHACIAKQRGTGSTLTGASLFTLSKYEIHRVADGLLFFIGQLVPAVDCLL